MKNNNKNPNRHAHCDIIAAQIEPFIAELGAAGYAASTLRIKYEAILHFVNWRRRLQLKTAGPDESEVTEFMASACRIGVGHRCLASTALSGFLHHLRHCKLISASKPKSPETTSLGLAKRYAEYLRNDKGLAELTLLVYLPVVHQLIHYLEIRHGITSMRRLDADVLRAFLKERAQGRSSEYVRLLASSLRSFLRFLHVRGQVHRDLAVAIPSVRRWSQPGVPKKLTPEEVDRVLDAPDRATASGRRDYAILLLLAGLGLRASEVLSLELGDIRWRTGEVLIRGKGGRRDLLPLPRDVGAAIARYLRLDRGVRPTQRVFLRTYAPRVPLTGPASIGHIVRRALAIANIERPAHIAAHLFRHTLASRMLQQGADLRSISEALRHRAISSTEIYAKIDMRSLNEVVRPWPTQGGAQ